MGGQQFVQSEQLEAFPTAPVSVSSAQGTDGQVVAEPGHHAFPPLSAARPPRRPCTPPPAADRRDLAPGHRVNHLLAPAHRPASRHLTAGHRPDKDQKGEDQEHSGPVEPGAPAASRDGPLERPKDITDKPPNRSATESH